MYNSDTAWFTNLCAVAAESLAAKKYSYKVLHAVLCHFESKHCTEASAESVVMMNFCRQIESNRCQSWTAWDHSVLDVKQWGETRQTQRMTLIDWGQRFPAVHCRMTERKKTTAWWRSESCPHNFSLTSTNRYTTCGDSIRKPLAADRLWANCCLGGIQKWEGSVYKDKNTPWNPSTCDVLYNDRKLSYIALRRWRKDFWKCSKLRVHLNQSI